MIVKRNLKIESLIHLFLPVSIVFIWLIFIFKYDTYIVRGLFMGVILVYLALSLTHHKLDKSLTREALFEYILLGSLAAIIVLGSQQFFR